MSRADPHPGELLRRRVRERRQAAAEQAAEEQKATRDECAMCGDVFATFGGAVRCDECMALSRKLDLATDRVRDAAPELDLSHETEQVAARVAARADGSADVNLSPSAVAAAALWYVGRYTTFEHRTQERVADVVGCSTVSIRKAAKRMVDYGVFHP
jgi:hypothetical protein